jgi:hypothetical protein
MNHYTKYVILRFLALVCILGAGYGYITANLFIIFGFIVAGIGLGTASVYFRGIARSHKGQASVAVETLSRLAKGGRK